MLAQRRTHQNDQILWCEKVKCQGHGGIKYTGNSTLKAEHTILVLFY